MSVPMSRHANCWPSDDPRPATPTSTSPLQIVGSKSTPVAASRSPLREINRNPTSIRSSQPSQDSAPPHRSPASLRQPLFVPHPSSASTSRHASVAARALAASVSLPDLGGSGSSSAARPPKPMMNRSASGGRSRARGASLVKSLSAILPVAATVPGPRSASESSQVGSASTASVGSSDDSTCLGLNEAEARRVVDALTLHPSSSGPISISEQPAASSVAATDSSEMQTGALGASQSPTDSSLAHLPPSDLSQHIAGNRHNVAPRTPPPSTHTATTSPTTGRPSTIARMIEIFRQPAVPNQRDGSRPASASHVSPLKPEDFWWTDPAVSDLGKQRQQGQIHDGPDQQQRQQGSIAARSSALAVPDDTATVASLRQTDFESPTRPRPPRDTTSPLPSESALLSPQSSHSVWGPLSMASPLPLPPAARGNVPSSRKLPALVDENNAENQLNLAQQSRHSHDGRNFPDRVADDDIDTARLSPRFDRPTVHFQRQSTNAPPSSRHDEIEENTPRGRVRGRTDAELDRAADDILQRWRHARETAAEADNVDVAERVESQFGKREVCLDATPGTTRPADVSTMHFSGTFAAQSALAASQSNSARVDGMHDHRHTDERADRDSAAANEPSSTAWPWNVLSAVASEPSAVRHLRQRLAMPVDALSASPSLAPLALPQRLRPQQSSVATSTTSLPSIVALQPAVASPLSQTAVQTDALPRPALVSASSPHVNPSTTANTATKVASGPAGHDSLSSASAAGSTSVFLPHEQWQQLQQFQQYQSMMYQQQLQQQWFLQHAAQQQHSQHPQQLPLMLPFPFPAVNPWMGPFAPVGPIPPLPNASPLNSLRGNQNTSSAYVSSADSSSANSPTLEQSRSEARQPSAIANASQPVERAHELLPAAVSTLSSEPASIASDAAVEIAPISSAVSLAIDPSSATDEALSIPMLTPSDACAAPLPLPASSSVTPSTVCLSSSTRAEDVLPSSAEARPFAVPVAAASSSHASLTAPEPVPSPIPEPMTNQRADSTIVAQGVVRYQDTGLSTAAASHNSPADGPSLSFTVRDGLSLHLPRLPTSIEFQPVHHEHHPSAIAGATTTSLPGPSSTLTAVASDVETPAPVPSSVSALPSNPVASATSAASLASLAAASTDPYIARLLARMPDLVHDPQWPQFVRQLREVRGGGSA